jgi:non-lysosomal glucosylceramidase
MSECCGGKPCGGGGCGPDEVESRYPDVTGPIDPSVWARSATGTDQFSDYSKSSETTSDQAYTYAGAQLGAFAFPLGGFGAGHLVLRGDGTLQKWCVVNQIREESQPLDCMPGCFFGVSAGGQAYVLASPETYTEERCALQRNRPGRVASASVKRLKALPGIKSLSVVARYPVANVAYEIPGFPVDVSMRALSPMVPLDDQASALPCALFSFSLHNTSAAPQTVRLLQSQTNFVGWDGQADCTATGGTPFWGGNVNTPFADGTVAGLSMGSTAVPSSKAEHGTVAAAALPSSVGVAAAASLLPGEAGEEALWKAFVAGGDVPAAQAAPTPPSANGATWCGGIVQSVTLQPGEGQCVRTQRTPQRTSPPSPLPFATSLAARL